MNRLFVVAEDPSAMVSVTLTGLPSGAVQLLEVMVTTHPPEGGVAELPDGMMVCSLTVIVPVGQVFGTNPASRVG